MLIIITYRIVKININSAHAKHIPKCRKHARRSHEHARVALHPLISRRNEMKCMPVVARYSSYIINLFGGKSIDPSISGSPGDGRSESATACRTPARQGARKATATRIPAPWEVGMPSPAFRIPAWMVGTPAPAFRMPAWEEGIPAPAGRIPVPAWEEEGTPALAGRNPGRQGGIPAPAGRIPAACCWEGSMSIPAPACHTPAREAAGTPAWASCGTCDGACGRGSRWPPTSTPARTTSTTGGAS